MRRVDEKFVPRLEEMPGFLAYQAIDAGVDRAGEGTVFVVTICSDREAADRSAEIWPSSCATSSGTWTSSVSKRPPEQSA
jgi:hypothetical protein